MRLTLIAMGRLRQSPELDLVHDYRTRFDRSGRGLGLGPLSMTELEDKKGGGKLAEAALITKAIPKGAKIIALDEHGRGLTSPQFSTVLAGYRDQGVGDLALIIGGADGLDASVVDAADMTLSLGAMVWPHMLARVMICEQLYRAASILAGSPYHRE